MKRHYRFIAAIVAFAALVAWPDASFVAGAGRPLAASHWLDGLQLLLVPFIVPVAERFDRLRAWLRINYPIAWGGLFVSGWLLHVFLHSADWLPSVPPREAALLFGYFSLALTLGMLPTFPPSARNDAVAAGLIGIQTAVVITVMLNGGDHAFAWLMVLGGIFGVIVTLVRTARRNAAARSAQRKAPARERTLTRVRQPAD